MSQKNPQADKLWYKDAIIYELHVKAFFDSNGDGIGDMEGLLQKLDYLEDLGATAIWMLPFYPSPLRDDGYDIADYYTINPSYGDIETFKVVVSEAHKRGLKVITELVINHTSDQHPWFQRARKSPKGSKYREYYVWSDDPTKYKDARIIFTDYEPSNWSWDPVANAYYWHRFFHHQPDLNFDNPDVQQEIFSILDFWVNIGVDGFRLDAVPYLFERDGTNCENLSETHDFLKKLRKHVDTKFNNILLLAEANMWPEDSVSYFGEGDECHMNYHFPIMPRLFMSVKMEDRYPIIDIIDQTPAIPDNCQWAIFLRNHDELTLEMVTDEERDYMYKVYTKDAQAKINLGIRQRLAPLLDNNRQKVELLNTLLFSLPGTPVIYYGDEIGMGDNFYLGDRDGVRTPMQWSPDRNAGFSNCNPHQLYLPIIIDPEYKYDSVNVETQRGNSSSLFWWMKRMIAMRKKFRAFSRGEIRFLSPGNAKVLAFIRSYEDEQILVLANLSRFSQSVELDLEEFAGAVPVEVFGQNKFPKIKDDEYVFTLSPYAYFWFVIQEEDKTDEIELPLLKLESLKDINKAEAKAFIEAKILPPYLKKVSWYRSQLKKIQDISITTIIEEENNILLTIEVTYDEGLPEHYLIGIAFCPGEEIPKEGDEQSLISRAIVNGHKGYFIDSSYNDSTRMELFRCLKENKVLKNGNGQIIFNSSINEELTEDIYSYLLSHRANNTIINFSDRYVLKLFRQIDQTVHPDLEITKFLSENVQFPNTPTHRGSITLKSGKKEHQLGMVHEYIESQGSAWSFVNDALKRFYERLLVNLEKEDFQLKPDKFARPAAYPDLTPKWQELLGYNFIDKIQLLGKRTAELHQALALDKENPAFSPEDFSLHYQRSLFSPLQGLTRVAFSSLRANIKNLPEDLVPKANDLLQQRTKVLDHLKMIYSHKFNAKKIRNHGDLQLKQVLWNGKDFIFIDFEGELFRPFSERRLKRSPLRDVGAMIRSLHYAAYNALLAYDFSHFDDERLPLWAENWHRYMSGFFVNSYKHHMQESDLIPHNEDFNIMLRTYQLERLLIELRDQTDKNPEWSIVPINGILQILEEK
jgi:maltose alpha-D-glucosyltransferase/alpha-amylase